MKVFVPYLLLATATAFTTVSPPTHHRHLRILGSSSKPLSDVDEMCIENMANICEELLECDLDEQQAILNRLQDQRDYHAEHVAHLDEILKKFGHGQEENDVAINGVQP